MKNLSVSFGFVKIPVSDFARSTAFYRDVLGLQEDFAVEQYGWAQYNAGNASICLSVVGRASLSADELGGAPTKPGIDTGIQLRVTNAKAAYDLLKTRSAKLSKLDTGDDGTSSFAISDPDGNKISIAQVPTG